MITTMADYSAKVLYLIGGPNGSGKTTLANSIITHHENIKFINADEIARENNISLDTIAGRIVLEKMDEVFSTHDSFIFETTLAGKFPGKLIKRAHDSGYKIEFLYVILSSVEQNITRVQERVKQGGHSVPENVIRRRYDKSLFNFDNVYKLVDNWHLYDNTGIKHQLVATGSGLDINIINQEIYSSFIKHKDAIISRIIADAAARRAARLAKLNTAQK